MTNEEAKIMLLGYMYWHKKGFNKDVFSALCCALEALSEDSQPVKHGEWEKNEPLPSEWQYKCSECGVPSKSNSHNYCPNCGSKMDKE